MRSGNLQFVTFLGHRQLAVQLAVLSCIALAATPASGGAGDPNEATIWSNQCITPDTGWIVNFPTGSSDYWSNCYSVVPGIVNVDGRSRCDLPPAQLAEGLPVRGVAVSVADFGSGRTYATVGVFNSNLTLDSTGCTADLASPISSVSSPPLSPPALFNYVGFQTGEGTIAGGTTRVVGAVQLPPGDSGLLAVGADSNSGAVGTSGFTSDGFTTPAIMISFIDMGINVGQDNSTTTSCKQADRLPHGRLRASNLTFGIGEGDEMTMDVAPGDTLDLAFYGTHSGDLWKLYYTVPPCTAVRGISVLPSTPDPDGDGSYMRVNFPWPSGYGGQTFRFTAAWGNASCNPPGVGFTNCITIVTQADPKFGVCDDGTIESGWVVQIPSGSSDYFNNDFGDGSSQNGVVGLALAVLDFGTATPAFPTSGVSNANFGVDPSGHTPDIGSPLATVNPFTFPAFTFATTSGLYISHVVSVPGGLLGTNVHGWVQFPPGDSGLLNIGADSSSGTNGCSFFTVDGYSGPAISFFTNWGIRLATN